MRLTWIVTLAFCVAGGYATGCAQGDDNIGGGVGGVGGVAAFGGGGAGGGTDGGGFGGFGNTGGGGSAGAAGAGATGGTAGGTGATGGTAGGTGATGGTTGCTPPVPSGQCDTWPQCGCNAGQACDVGNVTTGATQCVPDGTVQPYKKCGQNQFCVAGYACVGSACKQYCNTKADCPKGNCFQVMYDDNGTSKPVPEMKVCSAACKLENPAADCGAGLGCYPDNATPVGTDCAAAGTATGPGGCTGTPQNDPTKCAPGYACLQTGDCRKWCRVGFSTDCPSGTCTGFGTPFFVDGLEYGVCP